MGMDGEAREPPSRLVAPPGPEAPWRVVGDDPVPVGHAATVLASGLEAYEVELADDAH